MEVSSLEPALLEVRPPPQVSAVAQVTLVPPLEAAMPQVPLQPKEAMARAFSITFLP